MADIVCVFFKILALVYIYTYGQLTDIHDILQSIEVLRRLYYAQLLTDYYTAPNYLLKHISLYNGFKN